MKIEKILLLREIELGTQILSSAVKHCSETNHFEIF